MSIALLLLAQCTIQQNINITIMNKKSNHKVNKTYRSSATWKTYGGEKNDGKSLTVQNESYTIQELLEKHTQGLMPNVGKEGIFDYEEATHDDDITLRKPNLDLTDIDELKEKVVKTKTKLSKIEKAKQKREKEKLDRSSEEKVVKPTDET